MTRGQKLISRLTRTLLILCIFLGGGALFGGVMAFISPDFMGAPLLVPILQEIPIVGSRITTLAIPATALLLFIFVPHAITVLLMFRKHPWRFTAAIVCGVFVIVFTAVEMIFMPNPVSVLFLLFGAAEITLALGCQGKSKSAE